MILLDKIKSGARREAWKDDSYNPFGKIPWQKRASRPDEEASRVPTNRTESFITTAAEHRRRSQGQLGQDEYQPHHANTMPSASKSTQPNGAIPSDDTTMVTDLEKQKSPDTSEDSGNGTSQTIVGTPSVADNTPRDVQPRRRREKFLHPFQKGKTEKQKPVRPGLEDKRRHSSKFFAKDKQKFTFASQIRATFLNSWINILLVFVPVGIILEYTHQKPILIFVINFIAIIPLAAMLSYATEEIALRVGETLGGLLNATFG